MHTRIAHAYVASAKWPRDIMAVDRFEVAM